MKQQRTISKATEDRPVYFISNRPESYECWGEVGREKADRLARIIAEHAAKQFPGIDFRIDGEWHSHDPRTTEASSYIESHWQSWTQSGAV
jgi:hypothetical protein